ncbi:MAG: TRAP transporter large permease [Desulfobacterales bacterium]|jgi:tripartite ATP-independent transporter DctM subunit
MLILLFVIMIVLLVIGFPMMIPVIAGPIAVMKAYFPMLKMQLLIQPMISGVRLMSLIAIPMFIFAAGIMTQGKTANRLIDLVLSFIQHLRGGSAIATSAACTLFGSISGSTQATVVAMGQPMLPRLVKMGYSSSYSLALIINASDIALLIPPSIGMIVYGVVTGTSVGELFIAGIGPGVLIFAMFAIYSYIHSYIKRVPVESKTTWGKRLTALQKALPSLGFPIIIIGGIYSGMFSPNEAAGVSILYAFVLEVLIYKSLKISDLFPIALETGVVTAVVFILIGMGAAFSWLVTFARIPNLILPIVFGPDPSTLHALVIITIAYFLACMFIDNIVVIMVVTPILFPIAAEAGVDPVALGAIVTLQAAIGSATPPFGCDIFTAIAIFRRPYLEVIRSTPPFIFILMLASVGLIFYPQIALFLRDLAFR